MGLHPTIERRFRAMGTDVHVLVHGSNAEAWVDQAEARIEGLEARWSRFRTTSEVSLLNAAGGGPCRVSSDTCLLVEVACEAWRATDGRFDPTQLEALCDLGYDAPWPAGSLVEHAPMPRGASGCDGIVVDRDLSVVWLPGGLAFDPGGIGKGLTADIVADELLAAGAIGVLVNVGGDLRVRGVPADGGPWRLDIEPPGTEAGRPIAVVELTDGAVATSSTARRRWSLGDGTVAHHLLDPRTGLPADSRWESVTVVAGTGWWAEALTKSVLLGAPLDQQDCAAVVVDHEGHLHLLGDRPERFLAVDADHAAPAVPR